MLPPLIRAFSLRIFFIMLLYRVSQGFPFIHLFPLLLCVSPKLPVEAPILAVPQVPSRFVFFSHDQIQPYPARPLSFFNSNPLFSDFPV